MEVNVELGNLLFGHSRGEFLIERGVGWERELFRLFDAYAPDRDNSRREYGVEFENDVFAVMPYYWGDCTCGYDEKEYEWFEKNHHEPHCYQSALREAEREWLAKHPKPRARLYNVSVEEPAPGMVLIATEPANCAAAEAWRKWYREKEAFMNKLYDRLCAEYGLDRQFGCAVHCTCNYKERWAKFCAENDHDKNCPIVKPNFHYKPLGFEIRWYKYPLRDSYMNMDISLEEFASIIDECIKSLNRQAEGQEAKRWKR